LEHGRAHPDADEWNASAIEGLKERALSGRKREVVHGSDLDEAVPRE
jgi:hypothetical protein